MAERKTWHLLEVARSLMFTMNASKSYWDDLVLTVAYLINRIPLRVLNFKSPVELLQGVCSFIVSPKVFGCVCFIRDQWQTIEKLDPGV
jgi:hypothetical protein